MAVYRFVVRGLRIHLLALSCLLLIQFSMLVELLIPSNVGLCREDLSRSPWDNPCPYSFVNSNTESYCNNACFKLVNVNIVVKDINGTPIEKAQVKAFSDDYGIQYPDWLGETNESGMYEFRLPVGNWSFFAGGGNKFVNDNPGRGYFVAMLHVHVTDNITITLQPDDEIVIESYDIDGQPLNGEIWVMESSHTPMVVAPRCGRSDNGQITLEVSGNYTYDILFHAFPPSDVGYIFHETGITPGSTVQLEASGDMACITFRAYDKDGNLTGTLHAFVNYHNFSVGIHTGLQAVDVPVDGERRVYLTPELIGVSCWLNLEGWWYKFCYEDYNLAEGQNMTINIGGPLNITVRVLRERTQIWLEIRDNFTNLLTDYWSDVWEEHVPIRLIKDNETIYEGDLAISPDGTYAPWLSLWSRLDQTYDVEDSPSYVIELNMGPYGFYNLTGVLLSNETLLDYEQIVTDHFVINAPTGYTAKFNRIAELFEQAYTAISNAIDEGITEKTSITFFINEPYAGCAGRNMIRMGTGFTLDSTLEVVPSTGIEVAFHELGHVFQLSPPLENYYITAWFGEPFATLLAHEAIRTIIGYKYYLHQQDGHSKRFFDYISSPDNPDLGQLITNIQFVLFYLRKHHGMEIHRDFIHIWANETTNGPRKRLEKLGFNVNETVVILYSYLVNENLAWLFNLAGLNVMNERIEEGLRMLKLYNVSLQFYEGWNLIGLPIWPYNCTVEAIFGDMLSHVKCIYGFSNGEWRTWSKSVKTLATLEPGRGYWVLVDEDFTLQVNGTIYPRPELKKGWNLIAVCGGAPNNLTNISFDDYLLGCNWHAIYDYDEENDRWRFYIKGIGGDITAFELGEAYWVYIESFESYGLRFTGDASEYVFVEPVSGVTGQALTEISIEFWVKLVDVRSIRQIIEGHTQKGEIYVETRSAGSSVLRFHIKTDNGTSIDVYSKPLSLHKWYHVVVIFNGTGGLAKIYINGELQGEKHAGPSGQVVTITTGFRIARDYESYTQPLNGVIDNMRIYTRALTEDEVISNMQGDITVDDLVLWYGFDEGSGNIVHDLSGNGNDGIIYGDPEWVLGVIEGENNSSLSSITSAPALVRYVFSDFFCYPYILATEGFKANL